MGNFVGELGGILTGEKTPVEGVVAAGASWLDAEAKKKQAAADRKAAAETARLSAVAQANAQADTKKTALIVGGLLAGVVILWMITRRKG